MLKSRVIHIENIMPWKKTFEFWFRFEKTECRMQTWTNLHQVCEMYIRKTKYNLHRQFLYTRFLYRQWAMGKLSLKPVPHQWKTSWTCSSGRKPEKSTWFASNCWWLNFATVWNYLHRNDSKWHNLPRKERRHTRGTNDMLAVHQLEKRWAWEQLWKIWTMISREDTYVYRM